MKLAIFVHDLHLEIGHSNAIIEVLRNLPTEEIEEIKIIAYTCSNLKKLFPQKYKKVNWQSVPLPKLYPFIFKEIFYQSWSLLYSLFYLKKEYIKVGIGHSCLNIDIVNVQFIHGLWEKEYLASQKDLFFRYLYKKVLYKYFYLCEKYLFSRPKLKIIALSQFIADYIMKEFKVPAKKIQVIYSGINLDRFNLVEIERTQLHNQLIKKYPQIKEINTDLPIFLFVGAYERKGLLEALKALESQKTHQQAQIIVIGKHESKRKFYQSNTVKMVTIAFTDELDLFYSFADCFIFPTKYEPFGLVILEAAAMGINIITNKNRVGAAEILTDLPGIWLMGNQETMPVDKISPLSLADRRSSRQIRIERLEKFSWQISGELFFQQLIK